MQKFTMLSVTSQMGEMQTYWIKWDTSFINTASDQRRHVAKPESTLNLISFDIIYSVTHVWRAMKCRGP
jgi:hypothetical protein